MRVCWFSGVGALLNGSVDVVVSRGSDVVGVSSWFRLWRVVKIPGNWDGNQGAVLSSSSSRYARQ